MNKFNLNRKKITILYNTTFLNTIYNFFIVLIHTNNIFNKIPFKRTRIIGIIVSTKRQSWKSLETKTENKRDTSLF